MYAAEVASAAALAAARRGAESDRADAAVHAATVGKREWRTQWANAAQASRDSAMQTRQLTNEAAQGYTWAQLVGELAGLEMPDRHAVQRRRPRQLRGQTAAGADQRPDGKIVTEEPEHQLEALLAQIASGGPGTPTQHPAGKQHLGNLLRRAAWVGDLGRIGRLAILLPTALLLADTRDGTTAAHWACAADHAKVIRLLVNAYSDPRAACSSRDSSGRTPLHWACLHGAPDCAAQLQACDPAGWEARDKDGATPAHLAAACGHVAVLSTLRESLATRRERRLLMAAKDAQGANPRQVWDRAIGSERSWTTVPHLQDYAAVATAARRAIELRGPLM